MKVKELIEYLKKCNQEYDVKIDDCDLWKIVEFSDITEAESSYVNLVP